MPSYLPLLLNPLLNSLFNNPLPEKSPLVSLYSKLAASNEESIVILVPPLKVLLYYRDNQSDIAYKDLCYNEDFLNDHILTTTETGNAKLYTTFNHKEVLIKKDVLFTGKGFKKSLVLKVLEYSTFQSFNDYLPKGKRFLLLFIENPLVGVPIDPKIYDQMALQNTNQVVISEETEESPIEEEIKFEQIIRNFPLIASRIGQQYQELFRNFNLRDVSDTDSLVSVFEQSINLSSHIFQTLSDDLIEQIYKAAPNIDLNSCVYHYVELNLYDKIWNKLCDLTPDFLMNQYKDLENLSINQLSLPDKIKFDLSKISSIEKSIDKAVIEFKKLVLTNNYQSKIELITETIQILSDTENILIDADTLVGLLVLVVLRSNVPFLEAHLFYVENFSYEKLELGLVGYSLSTFEGVLYYLKNPENIKILKKYSLRNKRVFNYINSKELLPLKKFLDNEQHKNCDSDSSLKARTHNGESLLALAIQSNDYDTWKLLIDYEKFFPLEDLLNDKTISNSNLLNIALNSENFEIIDDLTEILLSSCTTHELKSFLNLKDNIHNRTIGHYLFHYKDLIPKLGKFIDWRIKDINGQTPLFAICRSYDTPNYAQLVKTVFDVVDNWYVANNSTFDYGDHIDHRGNTLLHILNSNIEHLLRFEKINVNESNSKSYTPLMIFVKYNRLENITKILSNSEFIEISKNDKNYFSCLDHSKNTKVSKIIETFYLNNRISKIKSKSIAIIRVKLERNMWNLVFRGKVGGKEYEAIHSFTEFKQFLELLKLEVNSTTSFLPIDYILKKFSSLILNIPGFSKLKLNNLIDEINVFFQILLLCEESDDENGLLFSFLKNQEFNSAEIVQELKLTALVKKESILKINHINENEDLKNNTFFLQPEEINEINFFLKFSLKEVLKYNHCFDKLFKVVNFNSVKQKELNDSLRLFINETTGSDSNFKELEFIQKSFKEMIKEFKFNKDICDEILQLSISTNEFYEKINDLINNKIFKWWKLYGELIELNNNYKKFKSVELKRNKQQGQIENHGIIEINEESFNDFTSNNNSFQTTEVNKKKTVQPSFLINFVESKRQKFELKLLDGIKNVKSSLIELNKDIKFNHELIAMELNNFLNFKNSFIKIIIKKYVKTEIKDLKFKNIMLERSLEDLRALKR